MEEKIYKKSQFNHEVMLPGTDSLICYNFRSHKFACLNSLQKKIFDMAPFNDVSGGLLKELSDKGMLVEGDEIESLKDEINMARGQDGELHISIDVNNRCNFSCIYCLESGLLDRQVLSESTAEGIIRFIKYFADSCAIDKICIIWFGGEPMLNPEIIGNISSALIPYADSNGIEYEAAIYTNGYNLSPDNVHMLERCRVRTARISIDGTGPVNDKYRHLKNGKGTYERIMDNIRNTKTKMTYRIRCNLNKENYVFYESLVNELKQLEKKRKPHCLLS